MVQIIKAVAEEERSLRKGLVTPPGFRMLFTDDMELIEPAYHFLRETCLREGRMPSADTQRTYAEQLYEWFSYLDVGKLDWDEADTEDLRTYAVALHQVISSRTRKQLSARTIRLRMGIIVQFYRWAFRKGLISRSITEDSLRNLPRAMGGNPLAHVASGPRQVLHSALLPRIRGCDDRVRVIGPQALRLLMPRMGPLPPTEGETTAELRPTRDRLAAEVGLNTGMRVDEVVSLEKSQILSLSADSTRPFSPSLLRIVKTKGLKPRDVFIPTWLVTALRWYVTNERAAAIASARRFRGPDGTEGEPRQLFLNGADANYRDIGRPLKRDTMMRKMRDAVLRVGLVDKVVHTDPVTQQNYADDEPRYSFHCLRHTFALNFYFAKKRSGDAEPWKAVQAVLGHAQMATTLKTYLRSVEVDEAALSDALIDVFQRFYGSPSQG